MEDFNRYLLRHVYESLDNRILDMVTEKAEIPSIQYLQQEYGMGWHDALNVQTQISKQSRNAT